MIAAPARHRTLAVTVLVVACLLAASCSSSSSTRDAGSSGGTTPAVTGSDSGATTTGGASATKVAAKPSPGCSAPTAPAAVLNDPRTIDVGGVQRQYQLTLPKAEAGKPLPLVLDFHGLAEGALIHSKESMFGELGTKEGFVVVQPNGTGQPVMWDTKPDPATNKDLIFVEQLVHQIAAEQCIDETRVYSTGLSMGAFMTSTLACTMSANLAAIAPVAGLQLPQPCDQARKVPILTYHGTADPILYFNGGIGTDKLQGILPGDDAPSAPTTQPLDLNGAGYPRTVRDWAAKYGCDAKPTETAESDHITLRSYTCPTGAAVDFAIVDGGGHTWPGSEFDKQIASIVGPVNLEVDATALIWKFFQRFQVADPPAL